MVSNPVATPTYLRPFQFHALNDSSNRTAPHSYWYTSVGADPNGWITHYSNTGSLVWYTITGHGEFSRLPTPSYLFLSRREEGARRIQRAYRAHQRRVYQSKALAFAMALHPKLGEASPLRALEPELLQLALSYS